MQQVPTRLAGNRSMADETDQLQKQDPDSKSWPVMICGSFGSLVCLYIFLVGLQLLGDSFKCLGGRGAGNMFTAISNPIAGLMIGVLATVLVQSSSTSTSIVVGLVGAHMLDVKTGIPVIMGANIGTSVTNTLVSMGQAGDRLTLQRAFAGATVHDMFNMLTVMTLLPLEILVGTIQGEGGPLYWITKGFTEIAMSNGEKGDNPLKDKSPTKIITSPVAKIVISNNKYIINALALEAPAAMMSTSVNESACKPLSAHRRLDGSGLDKLGIVGNVNGGADSEERSLLSRRLDHGGLLDCSQFFCVVKDLDKNFEKIDEDDYEELSPCEGHISPSDEERCGEDACYLDAGQWYASHVEERQIIKGGFTQGAGDLGGGIIALCLSLLLLLGGLVGLCRLLKWLFMGAAKRIIIKATKLNDWVAVLTGAVITVIVQSSSVTTSALTPLCGLGVLPLTKMLPVTLGANIGTTATALIASLASFTRDSVHIALCHLFFNIFGILIWFPVPMMRRLPLEAARMLGLYASNYRLFPVIYVFFMFVILPGIFLGLSAVYEARIAVGVLLTVVVMIVFGTFEFWWIRLGGCYKVLSKDARRHSQDTLRIANRDFEAFGSSVVEGSVDA